MTNFAARLTRVCEERGIVPCRLARLAGISKQGVLNLFHPDANPRLTTLTKLAAALGVPVAQLLSGEPATTARESTPVDQRAPTNTPGEPPVPCGLAPAGRVQALVAGCVEEQRQLTGQGVEEVAEEIGVSAERLRAILAGDNVSPGEAQVLTDWTGAGKFCFATAEELDARLAGRKLAEQRVKATDKAVRKPGVVPLRGAFAG